MILLVIVLVIIIAILNSNRNKFLFAPPKKCPNGYRAQGNACVPTTSLIQNGLNYVKKNPTKKIPDAYKPLVDGGYLRNKDGKWTSNPTPGGKPPAIKNTSPQCKSGQVLSGGKCVNKPQGGGGSGSGSGGCKQGQVLKGGKCVNVPNNSGGGGGASQNNKGGKSTYPSAPQQQKPTQCKFGGQNVKNCLLQYYDGDKNFIVTNDGKTLKARINPSSYDGSKSDKSKYRNRNEIALRDVLKKNGQTISFDFVANGQQNVDKNKSALFFQLKPEGGGGNDALIRLGIRDGKISYGIHGNDTVPTDIPANQTNNIQIKAKDGRGYLYINGQQIKNKGGEPISFSLGAADSTQIKFGLEAVPGQISGDVTGTYDNIQF